MTAEKFSLYISIIAGVVGGVYAIVKAVNGYYEGKAKAREAAILKAREVDAEILAIKSLCGQLREEKEDMEKKLEQMERRFDIIREDFKGLTALLIKKIK